MKYLALLGLLGLCGCDASIEKSHLKNTGEDVTTFSVDGMQGYVTRIEQKDAVCFVMIGYGRGGISCISKKDLQ